MNSVLENGNSEMDNSEWVRILVKDLRHSVSMEDVRHMFVEVYKLNITSEIKYAHYRDENKKLTSLLNGDRFVWVHPSELKHPLPRHAQCGIWKCRIFHRNQFPNSTQECYNCYSTDHQSKNCPNERCCRVCKEPRHQPGSPNCPHYMYWSEMRVFGGATDPLSNHFEKTFTFNHVEGLTVENHWFNNKALKNGQDTLASMCLTAESGREAKYLSYGIKCMPDWDNSIQGYNLMKSIVKEKLNQVKEARDELFLAWYNNETIVEGVHTYKDTYWGSGLNKEATKHTKPQYWPGSNMLGKIYMELADELFGENQWAERTPDNPYGKNALAETISSDKVPDSSEPALSSTLANSNVSNVKGNTTPLRSSSPNVSESAEIDGESVNSDDSITESSELNKDESQNATGLVQDYILASQEQTQRTRDQIGSLIADIRAKSPNGTPTHSPPNSPKVRRRSTPWRSINTYRNITYKCILIHINLI